MKLWISGEVDSDIGDQFRIAMNTVENEVNSIIEKKDYGTGLESWDIIFIISQEAGEESFKYKKSSKETDIRAVINHSAFKNANQIGQKKLMLDTLMRSLLVLKEKKISDFKVDNLIEDIQILNEKVG